ncbi:hypothetical protein F5X96DRAFT_298851 [Biscogniauxia mediterranea]|nr:hypothetical protein F5X96DRAFT_298851 [Biscogniauxia mediterranea]
MSWVRPLLHGPWSLITLGLQSKQQWFPLNLILFHSFFFASSTPFIVCPGHRKAKSPKTCRRPRGIIVQVLRTD